MNNKTIIAMSGGVDSSVAAFMLTQKGYDCIGVTMKLFTNNDIGISCEKSCCSLDDISDARSVACKLKIPYYVFNFVDDFKNKVISRFIDVYEKGGTPNPCIDCNRYIKFEKLFFRMKELNYNYIATGHYARIEYDALSQRFLLKKGLDHTKDQSYVLYSMTQEQLSHTLFPLGSLKKSDVRKIAEQNSFVNAKKHESQDICFAPNGDYAKFIEEYTGKKYESGNFIDSKGNIIGRHKGLIRYTVGQRRGLGLALPHPLYVSSKSAENNTIVLCKNESLFSKSLNASDINWITFEKISDTIRVKVKIRYNQKETWASVIPLSFNRAHIEFDEPQRAVASGQAVVFYDGDIVVGGGTID